MNILEAGCPDKAEPLIITFRDALNGEHYTHLIPLAITLEKESRLVGASTLCREMLDSILFRAKSPIYPHGIRHLKVLDRLAKSIQDWLGIEPHAVYKETLLEKHKLKISFWSKYIPYPEV